MQTREQRRYWANRRKQERAAGAELPKPRPVVLLATTPQEYQKLRAEYPHMRIRLDTSGATQEQLFNTREYHDV